MTDLLTLTGIGQRAASFQFELLDKTNSFLGDLTVDMDAGASITNSINRNPKRQMGGIRLPPKVTAEVNTLTERVKPWMVMQDGSRYPLGVFLFADASRSLVLSGSVDQSVLGDAYETNATMLDQLVTIDQGSRGVNFYGPGASIYDALVQQLEVAGVTDYFIEPTDAQIAQWVVWKPSESRLKVINDLAGMAGFYSLYFDNNGTAQLRSVPSLASVEPTLNYGPGTNVVAGSVVESDDLLDAPNTYVVVNSGFTAGPIWGEWMVPASAPNSFQNIGYHRVVTIDQQGIESNTAATKAAKAYGQADYATYRWVNLASAINPLHDTFDIVGWKTDKYREQSWEIPLNDSGDMKHELRRIWSDDVAEQLEEAA
jgi:hypothetical protein